MFQQRKKISYLCGNTTVQRGNTTMQQFATSLNEPLVGDIKILTSGEPVSAALRMLIPEGNRVLLGLVRLYGEPSLGECGCWYCNEDDDDVMDVMWRSMFDMFDDGEGDIVLIAGDIRGVDVDGDCGGGSDIGVEGDDIFDGFVDPLRLCFLYFTWK